MRRRFAALMVLGLAWVAGCAMAQGDLYQKPLAPRGVAAQARVLPARSIGTMVLRARPELAIEVLVQVEDYLPRALEPVLVIDGQPLAVPTRVVGVEGRTTTLGFLLEQPGLFREGAALDVQMGDNEKTRARVPGTLSRQQIRPAPPEELKRHDLPSVQEWLDRKPR